MCWCVLVTSFRVRLLDADTGDLRVVLIPKNIALANGLKGGSRVKVMSDSKYVTAWVVVSEEEGEEVLLSKSVSAALGNPEKIKLSTYSMVPSVDFIKKKLRGIKLSEDEIHSIIKDITSGVLSDVEIAAFVAAQTSVGMEVDEIVSLTKAMVETGNVLRFEEPAHDIHSIGGVPGNSKVSIVAVPIIASAGVFIPKTSSRAITSPAGTADTMEVFAPVTFTEEEVLELDEES